MATSFEKTWAFDLNRAYTPASALDLTRYGLWLLAAQLTGNIGGLVSGLWTLYASSDSVTAGTDSTDRWVLAGPYDGTKIVRGASTAVHSWIVLKSPTINGSFWYMTLSFNSSADTAVRVSFSKNAPTGGTTTATPTSSLDMWWPYNGASAADLNSFNDGLVSASRFSIGLASDGCWYWVACKQGAGSPNVGFAFFGLANYGASDLYPVAAVTQATGGTGLVWRIGSNSPFDLGGASRMFSRWFDGASVLAHAISYPAANSSSTVQQVQPGSASPITGGYPDYPALVISSAGHYRGRIPDLAVIPNSMGSLIDGSVSPIAGGVDSCRVGHLWVPANAAINFA